jgi:hypothetical protein
MLDITPEIMILNGLRGFGSKRLLIDKGLPDIPTFEWL